MPETGLSFKVLLGASPNDADAAIVSIDSEGTPGSLNQQVFKEYGYSNENLPGSKELRNGTAAVLEKGKKPILLVVTVGHGDVGAALKKNLSKALSEFLPLYITGKVWLPLLGTGSGGLTFKESYDITISVIKNMPASGLNRTTILISLPLSNSGRKFYSVLEKNQKSDLAKQDVGEFLKSLNCNFYVAGSMWDKEDQSPRFYQEQIWEKGHSDDSYSATINQVRVNDILIIKSTYAVTSGGNFLRIKAFGIVKARSEDGASLNVDWKIRDLKVDIPDLSYYRSTIAFVDFSDAVKIFSVLDRGLWKLFNPEISPVYNNPNKIPGILSDSDNGVDFLDITKDVMAFARVIAAKGFVPPLAIALFGKWGSGKSFFMRKLKEQIIDFSKKDTNGTYCKGVVHIHFNAWSYMDANLWASIVTRIFESLQEYISDNSKSEQAKKEIEAQLSKNLTITKEEVQALETKKNSIAAQIEELESSRKTINADINDKIEKIGKQTSLDVIRNVADKFNIKERITAAINENESYIKTEDELRRIVPDKYWNEPTEAWRQASSLYTFMKEFFRSRFLLRNLLWLLLILTIIFFTPIVLELLSSGIRNINFLIPQVGLTFLTVVGVGWRRAETVYKKLQPLVASFWAVKEEYDKQINEAVAKFEQQEKALQLAIAKRREELQGIDETIQKAMSVISDLEFRISNALGTEALYSFIEKRSRSDDYRKHLGIISIIRKDFEILNSLFSDHNRESGSVSGAEAFKEKFDKPLERIVLYIDDLDRCPEENVVQVLEAVNLLMAFPLFIVIVGVDPRWVKNALLKRYALQFTGKTNPDTGSEAGLEMIEASNYLEKIFQVPFHLKDAKDASVKSMIKNLAENFSEINTIKRSDDNIAKEEPQKPLEKFGNVNSQPAGTEGIAENVPATPAVNSTSIPEALTITELEILLMQDISEIVSNNPRAIKRFVNVYRIIKAHEEFNYDKHFEDEELMIILFLIALPLGKFKKLLETFEKYMNDKSTSLKTFDSFIMSTSHQPVPLIGLRNELDAILREKDSLSRLRKQPMASFGKHYYFIKRFAFEGI